MIVSWNWIKDYTDLDIEIKEFCDRMIMSGSNLETCTEIGGGLSGVVIGRIETIDRHPDADKLVVCQLNVGQGAPVQIVTGAPNVKVGDYVPVALDGSHIPGPLHGQPKQEGGVTITKGQLRGVESNGMLCSCSELGFDDKVAPYISKDGIWILEGDWSDQLGQPIDQAMDLHDYAVDFEITPNRPDCLSMIGMAREAAATFGSTLRYPKTGCQATVDRVEDYLTAEVRSDLCKRYTARVIKDVKIAQSPWWLQKRLMAAGMRPINNIVDLTNFVMMEYGQPMHAFDIRNVAGAKIIVEEAADGEVFTTLDGQERALTTDMLMIKDAERSIGIAGVMGGLNSEIEADTTTVVLESANFRRASIRTTSKALTLRTEASSRYEKGIDPNLCSQAADRFCALVEELGAGTVVEGTIDIYPQVETGIPVDVRVSRINHILGTQISREEMEGYLTSLECQITGTGDVMTVTPPTVRQDLLEEVDFVEEVARLFGYDNLPMTLPKSNQIATTTHSWKLRNLVRDTLCAMGANEVQTFSFVSPSLLDKARIPEDSWERDYVKILNPLGEDTSVMRTILTPSMLEVLGRNWTRKVDAVRAYEIGVTFAPSLKGEEELPYESFGLSLGAYGPGESFGTIKGMVETLLQTLGIRNVYFVAEKEYGIFHPGRCARVGAVSAQGEEIELGILGEVHPDVAESFGMDGRVYAAELMMAQLEELSDRTVHYSQPPRYPAMTRDIAMIVDEDLTVGSLETIIRQAGTDLLKRVKLFDVYRGDQVGEGKKSVAFSLTYRHDDRTLTDEETDGVNDGVMEALRQAGAVIRDN